MQCWDQVKIVGADHPFKGRAGSVVAVRKAGAEATVRVDAMIGDGGKEIPAEDVAVVEEDVLFLGR